jgi:endonuclease III
MKNSREYSKKVQKLYRKLKRGRSKVQAAVYEEPTDALVYATISENTNDSAAYSAQRRFAEHFIDLNDLRVSRPEEIIEVLGEDAPENRKIAANLLQILKAIFNTYHAVSLKGLSKIGKRPTKQALEKLDGTSHFTVNYCMLTAFQGHAIPLTRKMIEYLINNELIDPDANEQEIEGFLTRQISAKNGYEFYYLLRQESESSRAKRKTKIKTKTKKLTKIRKKTK